jgi:electron transfer flavoprotein beta subunit
MSALNIIVCLKQIPDPEGPITAYAVDPVGKQMKITGIPPVVNPFDENALEAALKLKDQNTGKVTIVCMGEKLSKPVLIKALGTGADDLILLEDTGFNELDSNSTAYVLSAAIKKIGGSQIILVGRQAGDWDFSQTGVLLAHMLGIPMINLAVGISTEENFVKVKRMKRNGYEVVKAPMPVVIGVDSQIGALRYPPMKALMAAKKKKPLTWRTRELGLDPGKMISRKLYQLEAPPSRFRRCVFIEGESLQAKGENLAVRMRRDGII